MEKKVTSLGVLIIGVFLILNRYLDVSDFMLGVILGIGIGVEVLGMYLMGRSISSLKD